nr:uncharacterized protein SPCC794.16 [Schizosaccharomyces pombe]G2TRT9.1 RecName: Full=Putative uncharacterized protein SPCC794.16 [Schizosaccharomyces pombe 972h-]CCD31391.1 dubious [Schizosaccharomyces pombe]|eukprot:NP_001343181.1 uncharacterized protein SPCC794.16 [Schizosaccharomyces pombe]
MQLNRSNKNLARRNVPYSKVFYLHSLKTSVRTKRINLKNIHSYLNAENCNDKKNFFFLSKTISFTNFVASNHLNKKIPIRLDKLNGLTLLTKKNFFFFFFFFTTITYSQSLRYTLLLIVFLFF